MLPQHRCSCPRSAEQIVLSLLWVMEAVLAQQMVAKVLAIYRRSSFIDT